jgi:phosphoribosylformylglycinamidine synthase I
MRAAVIVFPGSNCDRDGAVALTRLTGRPTPMIWHRETELPPLDLIFLPGGFSFGDYLRCGAIAAQSPVMREVAAAAGRGVAVIGICNGFQLLTESGLLPGALIRNAGLKYVCRRVAITPERTDTAFAGKYAPGQVLRMPVAHGDGNYRCDAETLAALRGEGRIAFRYAKGDNPNGALDDIAGIYDRSGRVLGMMPHPERAIEPALGSADGWPLFESLLEALG